MPNELQKIILFQVLFTIEEKKKKEKDKAIPIITNGS